MVIHDANRSHSLNNLTNRIYCPIIYCQVKGDRYYHDGSIKISKEYVTVLKGMNANYLTNLKEFDYRFLVRLLSGVFTKDELRNGCVRAKNNTQRPCAYQQLNALKIDFVKSLFHERCGHDKQRFETFYRHVNSYCSYIRSNDANSTSHRESHTK